MKKTDLTGVVRVTLLLLVLALASCRATVADYDDKPIDVSRHPIQISVEKSPSIVFEKSGWKWMLTPKAKYTLSGLVLHRERYHTGWNSIVSPCDVAMAWGPLVTDGTYKDIHWSQSGRWYWWRYGGDFPYDNAFIAKYSSNNHIIPGSPNLKRALSMIKRGRKCELQGLLVNVDGSKGGKKVWWHSSLSREDRGDGSCEILYLLRIKVNGKVYE